MRIRLKLNAIPVLGGLLLMCLMTGSPILAQESQNKLSGTLDHPSYTTKRATSPIQVDGILDEAAWADAVVMDVPFEYLPGDNVSAPVKTDFLITFNETHLYMAFRCFDPDPSKIRAHLMDRDAMDTFIQDDHVTIMIDFFNDERRGFQFRINPLGVQADANFSEMEGYEDFSWDAIWDSKGDINESGWVAEISIPFNQLRFPQTSDAQTWGISAERSYPRSVRHRIASHKRKRTINCILCQFNKVTGFQGMKTGLNMEIAPTLTANRTDDRVDFPSGNIQNGKIDADPGLSLRWGITPNLVLNAAINPDFSQVEADVRQLEINRRYAVQYPEKRPFFLEGADFFLTPIQAVFTRTVSDPDVGFKFTGKMGKNAFGIFGTYDQINNLLLPSNAGSVSASLDQNLMGGVFRFRRDIGQGSALGAVYTGRMGDDYFNHVAGVDGFFRLNQVKTLSFQYLRSETDYTPALTSAYGLNNDSFGGGALFFSFDHRGREWQYGVGYTDYSPGFRADFGYMPRVDIRMAQFGLNRLFWGKQGSWYNMIMVGAQGGVTFDYEGNRTDSDIHLMARYDGPLQSSLFIIGAQKREMFIGTKFNLTQAMVRASMKPTGGLSLSMMTHFGDIIDYSNLRLAWHMILNPMVEFNLGRHFNVNLRHNYMRLSVHGDELFTANLSQVNLIYNFNVRTFIRAIIQYQDVSNNPDLYRFPVLPDNNTIFTQFLFSYKLNPQTVLFIGYSDNYLGYTGINILQKDRTFFIKIGYAWLR
ncbi:DUF5916 domain-containing protein [Acidobacteriota bacterium]